MEYIKTKLDQWIQEKEGKLQLIVMNMESITHIDSTGAHELHEWIAQWKKAGIISAMSNIKGPIRDVLNRWNLLDEVGKENIFIDDHSACASFDHEIDPKLLEEINSYATQTTIK